MKINVSKQTIDNFLIVWNELSDTGPSDWEDNIELNGEDQSDQVDDIYEFIEQLKKYRGDECIHCGSGKDFCGCENL